MSTSSGRRDLLLVFGSVQRVMRAERAAREAGLDVDAVPAPRSVSSQCGVVLEAVSDERSLLSKSVLGGIDLEPQSVWRRRGDSWTPSALDAHGPGRRHQADRGLGLRRLRRQAGQGAAGEGPLWSAAARVRGCSGRHRVRRRCGGDPGLRRDRDHPHHRLLPTDGRRPLHLWSHRRGQRPVRCVGDGRHSTGGDEPGQLPAREARWRAL